MNGFTAPVATPGTPVPGVSPLLDRLDGTGVDRLDVTVVLVGGRWLVDVQWEGQHPDMPQTTATRTSGHGERLVSLEAAVALVAEDAAEGNLIMAEEAE